MEEQQPKGTIYLRDNAWYRMENVIKMGIASFAKDRSNTYITGEVERGEYISVIEIPLDKMRIIDTYLKSYFKPYNIYKGGGTEFYHRCIITLIEPYLQSLNIDFNVLTKHEIDTMQRCERLRNIPNINKIKQIFANIHVKRIIQKYQNKREPPHSLPIETPLVIEPKEHQKPILENIEEFFVSNDTGKIVWACGLGKALLSILIVKQLKYKTVVFGVPSNNLQKQIKNEILKVFPNNNNILFVGGDDTMVATNSTEILEFINNLTQNNHPKFVITTYHSCHLLVNTNIMFDFKVGDEAHHLVGIEPEKERGFRLFHKIVSMKTLFMTATEKTIDTKTNKETYSMENENIFGKYIDIKTVHWAIENKKITDYNILVLKNTEDEVDDIINSLKITANNKEIFMSCYMCLKSFEKYGDLTHCLLYTNTTEDSELAKKYIDEILSLNILSFPKEQIYNNSLHSKNCNDLASEIYKFKNSTYGIISCVYIFGEGFDLPKLNGVCIAGNMQSETRIVQYILRPNRLDAENPNKKAYVIIPYIDSDDWETETQSYDKLRTIVSHLRNVDENIEQKMKLSTGNKYKKKKKSKYLPFVIDYEDYHFEDNTEELDRIKLRLRYSKSLSSKCSEEEDEYNYVRSINRSLHIRSKSDYNEKKDLHTHYIPCPEEYFKSRGVWNNWYDFMCISTDNFIQSKTEWIKFCKEKDIKSVDDYYIACDTYDMLPKEPADFYKNFTNISSELGINKKRR